MDRTCTGRLFQFSVDETGSCQGYKVEGLTESNRGSEISFSWKLSSYSFSPPWCFPVLLNETKMSVRHFTECDPSILHLQNKHFQKAFQRSTSLRTSPVLTHPGPRTTHQPQPGGATAEPVPSSPQPCPALPWSC